MVALMAMTGWGNLQERRAVDKEKRANPRLTLSYVCKCSSNYCAFPDCERIIELLTDTAIKAVDGMTPRLGRY
jgi:hypothetical protein